MATQHLLTVTLALILLLGGLRLYFTWFPRRIKERGENTRRTLANVLTRPFSLTEWLVKRNPGRYQTSTPRFQVKLCLKCVAQCNCYAFVIGVPTCDWKLESGKLRPGDALPDGTPEIQPVFSWFRFRRALRKDGLRRVNWLSLLRSPGERYLVAMLYDSRTRDFHVFVLDAKGRWWQKVTGSAPARYDTAGREVKSPRRAATHRKYWFCGYFWLVPEDNAALANARNLARYGAKVRGEVPPV